MFRNLARYLNSRPHNQGEGIHAGFFPKYSFILQLLYSSNSAPKIQAFHFLLLKLAHFSLKALKGSGSSEIQNAIYACLVKCQGNCFKTVITLAAHSMNMPIENVNLINKLLLHTKQEVWKYWQRRSKGLSYFLCLIMNLRLFIIPA